MNQSLRKDIEGYLRVVAFGLSLVSPDTMTLLKAPGIVKTAHGNPLGDVARQTPSLLCKALHIRELGNPVKQTIGLFVVFIINYSRKFKQG